MGLLPEQLLRGSALLCQPPSALSNPQCLSSVLLPQTFSEVCLPILVVLCSVLVRTVPSQHAWLPEFLWDALSDINKRLSFMAEKLSYIERRIDAA